MKKYLFTGALALVVGGFLTSCHDNDGVYSSIIEQKTQEYQKLFVQEFGEIDPQQDWGFGTSSIAARTRAENKNLNEWGDPAKNGGQAWNVPPELTDRQKLRARLYFQYNPRLTYIDPHFTDFFVQQVYKGNPLTQGPYSPEKYYRVNGEDFTGSDEMDHLVCGNDTHINDFNNGEWNNGIRKPVLNTGANANDYVESHAIEGVSHLDKITLMVESSTEYIGYGASTVEGAKRRDCCANAGAKTIDNWANSNAAKALGIDLGDPVYDPAWNRSFVGLDYEAMKKADAYVKPEQAVKASDFLVDNTNFVIYQNNIIPISQFVDIEFTKDGETVKYLIDDVANEAVGQKMKETQIVDGKEVETDTHVSKSTFTKDLKKSDLEATYGKTLDGNSDVRVFNLDKLIGYINDGCNPTLTDKNMIKNIGGRDYVFSDWIVTLTEAKKVGNPDTQIIPIITTTDETTTSGWHQEGYIVECKESGRVFCEDLGVVRASDIDFNDLVFDAYIFKKTPVTRYWKKDSNGNKEYWKDERSGSDEYYAEVYLLAAGGTLDLTISGKKDDGSIENPTSVKPYMKVDKTTILNTIMPNGETYGNIPDNKDQAPAKLVFEGVSSIANISIMVFYKSEDQMTALELEAYQGAAPHKLCVPIVTQWPIERAEVNLAYPYFKHYVKGVDQNGKKFIDTSKGNNSTNDGKSYYEIVKDLWSDGDPKYIYTKAVSYPVPDTSQRFDNTGEEYEDQSTTTTGGYQPDTDNILVRRRH